MKKIQNQANRLFFVRQTGGEERKKDCCILFLLGPFLVRNRHGGLFFLSPCTPKQNDGERENTKNTWIEVGGWRRRREGEDGIRRSGTSRSQSEGKIQPLVHKKQEHQRIRWKEQRKEETPFWGYPTKGIISTRAMGRMDP